MSDDNQTVRLFPPGTLVWMKVFDRIWWPGKVVDPTTAPEAMQEYMMLKKKAIAMVYFELDNKYEVATNIEKISLYTGPKRMDYIKKGYFLSLREKKGTKIQNVKMENFKTEVIKFEEETNGNVNIFMELEKNEEIHIPPPKELIKELFVSSKVHEKKKSTIKLPVINFKTPSNVRRNLDSPSPKKPQESIEGARMLVCHFKRGCNFQTLRYEKLKRHMALCKLTVEGGTRTEIDSDTQSESEDGTRRELRSDTQSESENKRKSTTNSKVPKKTKINDEIMDAVKAVRNSQYDKNPLYYNPVACCSTMLTENIENYDKSLGRHDADVDSNEINDLTPSVSGTNMLIENSYQDSTDSETNYTLSLKSQPTSSDKLISIIKGLSIHDKEENQFCSDDIELLLDMMKDYSYPLRSNSRSKTKLKMFDTEEQENAKQSFLKDILNGKKNSYFYLDKNNTKEDYLSKCEVTKRWHRENFSPINEVFLLNSPNPLIETELTDICSVNDMTPHIPNIHDGIPVHICWDKYNHEQPLDFLTSRDIRLLSRVALSIKKSDVLPIICSDDETDEDEDQTQPNNDENAVTD